MKISFLFTLFLYIIINSNSAYRNYQFKQKLEAFDLNNNSFIDNEEITEDYKILAKQRRNRKSTRYGLILSIPVFIFFGIILYFFMSIVEVIKNKI